jgi:4-alpha-glucanotransferase
MKPARGRERAGLHELARVCGVEASYLDYRTGRPKPVRDETLVEVLRALGVTLRSPAEAPRAVRARKRAQWRRSLEPVVVAWAGRPTSTLVRLPARQPEGRLEAELLLESGETMRWFARLGGLPVWERRRIGAERYLARSLPLPPLPLGYHRLRVRVAGKEWDALVIAAPGKAFSPEGRERCWGLFLPMYSLRSKRGWGAGDFSDLEAFSRWVERAGGHLIGTLPILAAFLDEPFEPSPYSPASRLFWNEFYVDVARAPELAACAKAKQILNSSDFQRALGDLRAATLVDYRRGMALKRAVLEPLAETFFARREAARALAPFLAANPEADDYARFRAVTERRGTPWPDWPARLRSGNLRRGDGDEGARRYHLYSQWLAHNQLERFSARAARRGQGLYLDVPLGVHPHGYDVWRHRESFALEADAGAPPDPVWTSGQNWTFPPFHPERLREQGYDYFIAGLRHQLRYAAYLRIDHIMGFHRLFWIPQGAAHNEGAYVHYRAEEFYAILCLESQRRGAVIVGENLGSVPAYVNEALRRHHIQQMFVVQYELEGDLRRALKSAPANAAAGVNTHDMPPFAGWWEGEDVADRLGRGLIAPAVARQEYERRAGRKGFLVRHLRRRGWLARASTDVTAVFGACARYLAAARPCALVLNLEDFWGETAQQNVPGTTTEKPNWRRMARYALEEISRSTAVRVLLQEVNRLRKRPARSHRP